MKIFNAVDLPEVDMGAFRHRVRAQGKKGAVEEMSLSDASLLFETASVNSITVEQDSERKSDAGDFPFGLGDD